MSSRLQFDEKLWFTMGNACPGKHYLIGNPHTFNGRMFAWCPSKQKSFYVSKISMEELSTETHYWVRGFLVGNEPDPPVDESGSTAFSTPEYESWLKAVKLFSETGYWNYGRRCESCNDELLPSQISDFCHNCHKLITNM